MTKDDRYIPTHNAENGLVTTLKWITFLLITLKLTGIISWSWLWVLTPIWVPVSIGLTVIFLFGLPV